jgi:hypothetical protein
MDAFAPGCLRFPPMAEPFEVREKWRDVSLAEFEAFLRRYPRLLEARPPLTRKARYREWLDPKLGSWPENTVAQCWMRSRQPRRCCCLVLCGSQFSAVVVDRPQPKSGSALPRPGVVRGIELAAR